MSIETPDPLDQALIAARLFTLAPQTFGYYSSGSDDEITLRRNRADFDRFVLRPRMLQGVGRIDLGVNLFGRDYPWSVFISPTAMQMLAHPEGELAMACAAASGEAPTWTSTVLMVLRGISSRAELVELERVW